MKKVNYYPAGKGLAFISDSTGGFYCRPEHVEICLADTDTPCVSVCSNGSVEGLYIHNPVIPPYHWDDDGTIRKNEDMK